MNDARGTLLLVDDEENILRALMRVLRRDGYRIFTACCAQEGLRLLAQEPDVGVVISDQRMPGMTGSEFLGLVKERHPATIRIMLSGYTELKAVTDAVNEGAIYKFLTKPWDDDALRATVREAFARHESRDDVHPAATCMCEHSATPPLRCEPVTDISQEILEHLPVAVLGMNEQGIIALANRRAHEWLGARNGVLHGRRACEILPEELNAMFERTDMGGDHIRRGVLVNGRRMDVHLSRCQLCRATHGRLMVIVPDGVG
ncbi:MAG: response regulator [Thiohalomonadaceae bacterium]